MLTRAAPFSRAAKAAGSQSRSHPRHHRRSPVRGRCRGRRPSALHQGLRPYRSPCLARRSNQQTGPALPISAATSPFRQLVRRMPTGPVRRDPPPVKVSSLPSPLPHLPPGLISPGRMDARMPQNARPAPAARKTVSPPRLPPQFPPTPCRGSCDPPQWRCESPCRQWGCRKTQPQWPPPAPVWN